MSEKTVYLNLDHPNTGAGQVTRILAFKDLTWPWKVMGINVELDPSSVTEDSALKVVVNDTDYIAVIENNIAKVTFGEGIEVPAGGSISMSIRPTNCKTYSTISSMGTVFGSSHRGNGSYYTVRSVLIVNYTPIVDNNNYLSRYMTYEDIGDISWSSFKKDEGGYPYNNGVWKFDNQNDGYPWMTGYTPISIRRLRNATYMVVNSALKKLRLYYQDDNSLSDAQLFKLKEIK